jgi:hypothetical protein
MLPHPPFLGLAKPPCEELTVRVVLHPHARWLQASTIMLMCKGQDRQLHQRTQGVSLCSIRYSIQAISFARWNFPLPLNYGTIAVFKHL